MHVSWTITPRDIEAVNSVIARARTSPFVKHRISRNVHGRHQGCRPEQLWRCMQVAFLTSQQRSGPGSAVARFLLECPLSLPEMSKARDPEALARKVIGRHGGIRFAERLSGWMAAAVATIADRASELNLAIATLQGRYTKAEERHAARRIAASVDGLGPKQSRNLLQMLGLTRYEVPLDSRFAAWLQTLSMNFPIPSMALSDASFYEFVLDAVQELCERARVFPCVLDAAVFASADRDGWSDAQIPRFLRARA